jgi:hypothetical protein
MQVINRSCRAGRKKERNMNAVEIGRVGGVLVKEKKAPEDVEFKVESGSQC